MMQRRTLVAGAGAALGVALAGLSGCATRSAEESAGAASAMAANAAPPKPDIVLVHGAWHGGWCWTSVAARLRSAGYKVVAPTLPGMGERRAELSTAINLDSHIDCVVEAAGTMSGPVVLLGHSYGGFVVTGAADRLAHARADTSSASLAGVVYLDAFVPTSGQRVSDYQPPDVRAKLEASFAAGNAAYPKPPARFFGITAADQLAFVEARLTDQPAGTYLQPLVLRGPLPGNVSRTYIACNSPRIPVFDDIKRRARDDPKWRYIELNTAHDAMVTAPVELSDAIVNLLQPTRRA